MLRLRDRFLPGMLLNLGEMSKKKRFPYRESNSEPKIESLECWTITPYGISGHVLSFCCCCLVGTQMLQVFYAGQEGA